MKQLIKTAAVALMLIFSTTSAMAITTSKVKKEAAQLHTEIMADEFQLSKKQTDKIYKVNLKYIKKHSELMKNNLGQFYTVNLLKDYHTQKTAEIKEIFTPQQFAHYSLTIEAIKYDHNQHLQQ